MRYVDHADGTNINLKKGEQTLTGQQALDFVRYRKSNDGTRQSSDFERNDRQSRVLGAILDKLKSLDGVARLGNVIAAVGGNMRTDIPEAQIQNLMKTYFGLSRDHVRFIALEGTWRSPYVYLDDAKLEEAKLALKEELAPEGRSVQSP
jgi:anionic cell wall polymer biosynthesis LytR-Cps2A-Psr (LCP) family protein